MSLTVYYDGDCPFCDRYVRYLRLREAAAEVVLVDLRQDGDRKRELEAMGFDLDQGMVVDLNGKLTGGGDAINTLSLLSTPSSLFNRINKLLFSSRLASVGLYPLLRAGRWLTLFVLGRQGLNAEDSGIVNRAAIFALFFSLFSIFHFFNYALEYGRFPPSWDMYLLLGSAIALLFRPKSARLLALLMAVSTVSAILQAPITSNHTMVRNALLVGYWASFLYTMVRGRGWPSIFDDFALSGQGVLLVMYFYGIFHKINTGFLDPATSCAVYLWRLMPPPMVWFDFPAIHYLAIYGTFVVEGVLIAALLTRRLRHYAIVGGIAFHVFLALSSYAMYISFTTLAIALHSLFLSGDAANRIFNSPEMKVIRARMRHPLYILAALVLAAAMFVSAALKEYTYTTLCALPLVVPFCFLVIRYGRPDGTDVRPFRISGQLAIAGVITALFFVNGLMPYLGLKTAQSINMFANLRLEAGVSNHLVFSAPNRPFSYLEDVAVITDSGGDAVLELYKTLDLGLVYYALLVHLKDNPDLQVGYTIGDREFSAVTAAELKGDMDRLLHPEWVRKWFLFQPVNLQAQEPCNV